MAIATLCLILVCGNGSEVAVEEAAAALEELASSELTYKGVEAALAASIAEAGARIGARLRAQRRLVRAALDVGAERRGEWQSR